MTGRWCTRRATGSACRSAAAGWNSQGSAPRPSERNCPSTVRPVGIRCRAMQLLPRRNGSRPRGRWCRRPAWPGRRPGLAGPADPLGLINSRPDASETNWAWVNGYPRMRQSGRPWFRTGRRLAWRWRPGATCPRCRACG
jgi:hypothetical protein